MSYKDKRKARGLPTGPLPTKDTSTNHSSVPNQQATNTQEGNNMPENTTIAAQTTASESTEAIAAAEAIMADPAVSKNILTKLFESAPNLLKSVGSSDLIQMNKEAGIQTASLHVGRAIINNACELLLGTMPAPMYNWLTEEGQTYRLVGFKFIIGQACAMIFTAIAARTGKPILSKAASAMVFASQDIVFSQFGLERLVSLVFPKELEQQLAGAPITM